MKKGRHTEAKPAAQITYIEAVTIYQCIKKMPSTYFKKNVGEGDKEVLVQRALTATHNSLLRKSRELLQPLFDEVSETEETLKKNLEAQSAIIREIAANPDATPEDKLRREDANKEIQRLATEYNEYMAQKMPLPDFKKIPLADIAGWEPQEGNENIAMFFEYLVEY